MNNTNALPSIVFFGTPNFASHCLKALLNGGFPVNGVVTAPDRKAGRGKKISASAVKILAEEHELKILQPTNLKDPEFIDQLKKLQAEVFVVVAFRMLPRIVWALPKLGTMNLHASLLPNYRGAAPINWVLINGETRTGLTTFLINEEIDTGAILLQKEMNIDPEDDMGCLHDKLLNIGGPLIRDTLIKLNGGNLKPLQQQLTGTEYKAPKLSPDNTQLNWEAPLEKIKNTVRGLSPYPGAWTLFENDGIQDRLKIIKAKAVANEHGHPLKKIVIEENEILIATAEGYLNCLEIQLPNKKRMTAKALLNGYKFTSNARVL